MRLRTLARASVSVAVLVFVLTSAVFVATVEGETVKVRTKAAHHALYVSPQIFQMATKVAICEEGGWSASSNQHGPTYFGNLGWLDATWQMFKRPGFPARMDEATPTQQAIAMARFAGRYYWPDQNGCTGGY